MLDLSDLPQWRAAGLGAPFVGVADLRREGSGVLGSFRPETAAHPEAATLSMAEAARHAVAAGTLAVVTDPDRPDGEQNGMSGRLVPSWLSLERAPLSPANTRRVGHDRHRFTVRAWPVPTGGGKGLRLGPPDARQAEVAVYDADGVPLLWGTIGLRNAEPSGPRPATVGPGPASRGHVGLSNLSVRRARAKAQFEPPPGCSSGYHDGCGWLPLPALVSALVELAAAHATVEVGPAVRLTLGQVSLGTTRPLRIDETPVLRSGAGRDGVLRLSVVDGEGRRVARGQVGVQLLSSGQ